MDSYRTLPISENSRVCWHAFRQVRSLPLGTHQTLYPTRPLSVSASVSDAITICRSISIRSTPFARAIFVRVSLAFNTSAVILLFNDWKFTFYMG